MNFYNIIKLSKKIKSPVLKLSGIFLLHILKKRHLSVRIDPSLNCNLFCRMCYFSSKEYRTKTNGIMPVQDFQNVARVLFPYAFQVYIGCGAEPTTHRQFIELIRLANLYKVPNIGVVTNGQLLTQDQILQMVELNLQEFTLSCHGTKQETFEYFMTNSKFSKFLEVLKWVTEIKNNKNSTYPEVRINYTVNDKNLTDLKDFFNVFGNFNINTLQIRPVVNIGGKYSKSITNNQTTEYKEIIKYLKQECSKRKIRLLANTHDVQFENKNNDSKIAEAAYCYIGPNTSKQYNFDWSTINFKEFSKKTKWKNKIRLLITNKKQSSLNKSAANYNVYD